MALRGTGVAANRLPGGSGEPWPSTASPSRPIFIERTIQKAPRTDRKAREKPGSGSRQAGRRWVRPHLRTCHGGRPCSLGSAWMLAASETPKSPHPGPSRLSGSRASAWTSGQVCPPTARREEPRAPRQLPDGTLTLT